MRTFFKTLIYIIIGIAIVAVVGRIFFFEVGKTGNYSMVPSLIPGDIFLFRKVGLLGPGDVAICHDPRNPGDLVIGRIVGIPGDSVKIGKNHLVLNGRRQQYSFIEPMIYYDTTTVETMEYVVRCAEEKLGGTLYTIAFMDSSNGSEFRESVVPNETFFIIGDNRNMAYDSRNFGFVPIDSCIGEAVFLLWASPDNGDLKQSARTFSWIH